MRTDFFYRTLQQLPSWRTLLFPNKKLITPENKRGISIRSALVGLAVGDALGVPVEFVDRKKLEQTPVTTMQGYGTHNQPRGTWSDDSSLTFCLAESLLKGYDLKGIAQSFINWKQDNYWTPHGYIFDMGQTTYRAIEKLKMGIDPVNAGGKSEEDNGNGSLMRILPLVFYLQHEDNQMQRFKVIKEVSSLIHAHIRSVIACKIYVDFAIQLVKGVDKHTAYQTICYQNIVFLSTLQISHEEILIFERILKGKIHQYSQKEINSGGYVVETLEASLWCILKYTNFKKTVLAAVNLGGDTDTRGSVSGGLAGILYGIETIPKRWVTDLVRKEEIIQLADQLEASCMRSPVAVSKEK